MIRFFVRFIGYWLLAGGLVAAVVDGAKSIAASSVMLTPLSDSWALFAKSLHLDGGGFDVAGLPWPLPEALNWIMAAPTAGILVFLGFALLSATGRRRSLDQEFAL